MFKKYIPYVISIIFFLSLYYPVLITYFTQDDFFHFKIASTDNSLKGLFYLIGFHPFNERGIAFYRPIFRDLLYHFSYNFFGLNQIPLRVLSFIIHFINIYLIYIFSYSIFKNKAVSYFSPFFYAIATNNVATFYYLAGGIQTLGVLMFILISSILFIKYLDKNTIKYLIFSFIAFLLALASHEQSVIIPFVFLGLMLIKKGFRVSITKGGIKYLVPFFVTLAAYLYLNIIVIGYSSNEVYYQPVFSPKIILNSLIWYSGWALGLPEMLIDFAPRIFKLDPRLMRYWGEYFRIILPAFFVSLFLLFYSFIYLLIRFKKTLINKSLILFIVWFLIGISPVILFPFHKSGQKPYQEEDLPFQ